MVREILHIRTDNGLGDNDPTFHGIEVSEYNFKGSRMGMPELTATLMWESCLDDEWTHKEYVVLNGERFYIRNTPSSSKSNTDQRYKHEISFTSEFAEILGNTYFVDAVPSYAETYDKPCTNSTKFTFFGTISEFVDRLNCAFIYAGIADSILKTKTTLTAGDTPVGDGYCAMLDPYGAGSQYDANKSYEFSFEDKYLWEAITEGYNITEIPFERRGRKIIFGAIPKVVEHKFEYGYDNELLSVNKKNANAQVINRITMLGSSDNIPHYYPNESEYGHISIAAKSGNKVLVADMVSIVNMTQLLSRLNADSFAVLGKYGDEDSGEAKVQVNSYACAFKDNTFSPYTLDKYIPHLPEGRSYNIPWHIKVYFKVTQRGIVECQDVKGKVWKKNDVEPSVGLDMMGNINPENLTALQGNVDLTGQIDKQEDKVVLGMLECGDYVFQFAINIPNYGIDRNQPITTFCKLSSVDIGGERALHKNGYYWQVGDKKYDGVGSLGVKIDSAVTDNMIGDGFGWMASGRMPFQTNLMPPKYRETLGAERFYNALNDTYTDPDTGNDYIFPNPFLEGAPSEYIHKNEEIMPTLDGVKNAGGQLMGVIADIAYDANDNDALKPDATEDGDKNDSQKYEHSFFYIKLNVFNGAYGFDLFSHASQTDPMTLQMRSGSCNGCKFKIQVLEYTDENGLKSYKNPVQTTGTDGTIVSGGYEDKVKESWQEWQQDTATNSIWICVQKDASTFGVIMPNQSNKFLPKVGDTFNIINIDLPEGYILAAEKRLEEEGIRFMADNNEEKFTFDISASRIFFAEHPEILAQIDEYSKIKVKYNGKEYEQYVNQLTIDCKDSEALPNIGIGLTDTLAVGQSFVEKVAERASSLIANPYTQGGALGGGSNGLTTRLADQRYLNKTEADRSKGKIASDIGFEVGEFVSGGSGGIFYQDPETGQTYIEADKLKVRMKAIYAELEVAKESSIGGSSDITPGGGIDISFVEELADSYRCYFKAKDEDKGADCRFVAGDQVRCKESNISSGTTQDASNRYYWRLVTAVNNDESYIELSKNDCDTDSVAPMAGDTVVQLGNRNNSERQSAIVLSTVDTYAPCVTLYNGINNYSLEGKAVVEYGVDKSKNPPEPFFHCYGSFFFGPKGGDSYLKFDPSVGKLVFSGELINISTFNGKDVDEYFKDLIPPITAEDVEPFIDAVVDPKIAGLQNQIDGVIETWFYNGVPTLSNYPALEWNTENLKIQHLGDLYYDNDTGTAYRFSQNAHGGFYWNTITDDAITKALSAAQKAQDTADGKRRIFTSQPVPPYQQGDLWVNATYGTQYSNDILRCITNNKKEGGSFSIADWTLASKYTDDTLANQAIEEIAGYQYMRQAIANGATITQGSLILSGLIKLGLFDLTDRENPIQTKVYAGMNGIYDHKKTIASWWGGDMVDKYYNDSVTPRPNPLVDGYAQALIRMDGSGYLAGGNIRWDEYGAMTFGNGIIIDLGNGKSDTLGGIGDSLASLTKIVNDLSNALIPVRQDGTRTDWGANDFYAVKSVKGFYSDEWISCRGANPNAGSGTGASFGLLTDWSQYVAGNGDALGADLGWALREAVSSNTNAISLLSTRMSALEGKEFVTLNTTQEITGQKTHKGNVIISNMLYFKAASQSYGIYLISRSDNGALQFSQHNNYIWQKNIGNVDIDGNMTMNSFIKSGGTASQFLKADGSVDSNSYALASALGNYVKKSGDTMTGTLTLPTINVTSTNLVSNLNADLLDGLHSSDFGRVYKGNAPWNNGETVAEWAKRKHYEPGLITANTWAWVESSLLKLSDTVSLDIMRYSALSIRNGDVGKWTYQQNAFLFIPTYSENSMMYLAQLNTFGTAGEVSTSIKRYADYDTILSSNVASATRLQGTYSLWGQSFFGNNVSGNMTGVGSISFSYDSAADLDAYGNFKFKANGNNWNIFNSSGNALVRLIHSSGNLGIGCVPGYKLDINGVTKIRSYALVDDAVQTGKGVTLNRTDINTAVNATAYWYGLGLGAIESGVTLGGYYGLKIFTANGKYTMLQNGNHGINTDSPTATLDVNGTGLFRGNLTTNATLRGMDTYVNQLFFSESTTDTQVRPYLSGYSSKFNVAFHKNGVWQKTPLMLDVDGNMDLTGVFHATVGIWSNGYMSARGQNTSSDIRKKEGFRNLDLDIRDIACAPCVEFTWRKDGARDLGSIAQHFEKINPMFTPEDPEGFLTLQYGKTAMLYLIPTARMVLTHEDRIASLEKENKELKKEITRLQTITNN